MLLYGLKNWFVERLNALGHIFLPGGQYKKRCRTPFNNTFFLLWPYSPNGFRVERWRSTMFNKVSFHRLLLTLPNVSGPQSRFNIGKYGLARSLIFESYSPNGFRVERWRSTNSPESPSDTFGARFICNRGSIPWYFV